MGFFVKACSQALGEFPAVNSQIEGDEIVTYDYVDMGIAVSAPKGLMVPVIRNAETRSIAELETEIRRLAARARDNQLSLEEMEGGTFSITNGGVFGSMLSTPSLILPRQHFGNAQYCRETYGRQWRSQNPTGDVFSPFV